MDRNIYKIVESIVHDARNTWSSHDEESSGVAEHVLKLTTIAEEYNLAEIERLKGLLEEQFKAALIGSYDFKNTAWQQFKQENNIQ